jgi:high-affinity Fe2+/Pb2+ permease
METKKVVYGLAVAWVAVFAASFLTLGFDQQTGNPSAQTLNRVATFLTWQGAALVVAVVLALLTHRAAARGIEKIKAAGFLPLVLSTFVVVSFIAIVAYRVFVVPLVA